MEALCCQYDSIWAGLSTDPRQASGGTRLATSSWLWRPKYLFFDYPAPATCTYLRFRLGTHNLQVNVGRWDNARPHADRVCGRCALGAIDDEKPSGKVCYKSGQQTQQYLQLLVLHHFGMSADICHVPMYMCMRIE